MPVYCFKCECGKTAEEQRTMADRNSVKKCDCGKRMKRSIGCAALS
jgi:putative FmdB family regulatory protein